MLNAQTITALARRASEDDLLKRPRSRKKVGRDLDKLETIVDLRQSQQELPACCGAHSQDEYPERSAISGRSWKCGWKMVDAS